MSTYRLANVLAPRSLALVGASARPGSVGLAVLRNIQDAHFAGPLGIVNPRHQEIDGVATVGSLAELSFVPELVVIAAPAESIPALVDEAGRIGSAGVVIISSGLGHGPGSLSAQVQQVARRHRLRLIGPNCVGIAMPYARLNASFVAGTPRAGGLALISQSGAIVAAMVGWAAPRAIGFSGIVSVGDELDADIADLLDYFAQDPDTRAILLYLEAVKDAAKFMAAARAASRIKPVIVVKAGRMTQGAKAAATHTGALAGSDAVYDAAFRRAGLLRVPDLRDLYDCAEAVGRIDAPAGKRLAILTNGGGIGVLAVDRLVELGGIAAPLSPATRARLDAVLPPTWSGDNPVDIIGDADAARYTAALDILLADPDCDAVLVIYVEAAIASADAIASALMQVVAADVRANFEAAKPVLAAWIGADARTRERLSAAGIPNYATGGDAVQGFMHLVHHRDVIEAPAQVLPALPLSLEADVAVARKIVASALGEGRQWLDPVEIRQLFDAYRIPVIATFVAADAGEAAQHAAVILAKGDTVVLKILSRDITHKSDVGGVVLNLSSVEAVRAATTDMLARIRLLRPQADIAGVMVQAMVTRPNARELILGLADDATFGPVVVFGRGGTAVEVISDKALALPPLDLPMARDLIGRTQVSRLLKAYRDVPAVAPECVELTIVKLAQMAIDLPEIRELDINPLLADEHGVIAIDARVAVGAVRAAAAGVPGCGNAPDEAA
jgi:acetyltransferase